MYAQDSIFKGLRERREITVISK